MLCQQFVNSESLFNCLREWHASRGAFEYLDRNDGAVTLLSASCVCPGGLYRTSQRAHDTDVEEPYTPCIQLGVRTACCQQTALLAETERCALSSVRSFTVFCAATGTSGGGSENLSNSSSVDSAQTHAGAVVRALLLRIHTEGCAWQGLEPVRALLHAGSLKLQDSLVVRGRCAAVSVELSNGRSALVLPRGTPPSLLQQDIHHSESILRSCGGDGVIDTSTVHHHGTPVAAPVLRYVGSSTDHRILRLLFLPKRERGEDDGAEEGQEGFNRQVVANLCVLLRAYGYVMNWHTPGDTLTAGKNPSIAWQRVGRHVSCRYCAESPRVLVDAVTTKVVVDATCGSVAEGCHADFAADGDDDIHSDATSSTSVEAQVAPDQRREGEEPHAHGSGAALPSSRTGSEPSADLLIDTTTTLLDSTDCLHQSEEELQDISCLSGPAIEASMRPLRATEVEPATRTITKTSYTIVASNRRDLAGHCMCCPWRSLYVTPVVGQPETLTLKHMDFDFSIEDGGEQVADTLRLRFLMDEVQNLVQSWRASIQMEAQHRVAYLRNPISRIMYRGLAPIQLESADPKHAMVETFLKELSSSLASGADENGGDDGRDGKGAAAVPSQATHWAPVFYSPGAIIEDCSVERVVALAMETARQLAPDVSTTISSPGLSKTSLEAALASGMRLLRGSTAEDAPADATADSEDVSMSERFVAFRAEVDAIAASAGRHAGQQPQQQRAAIGRRLPAVLQALYGDKLPPLEVRDGAVIIGEVSTASLNREWAAEVKAAAESQMSQLVNAVESAKAAHTAPPLAAATVAQAQHPQPPLKVQPVSKPTTNVAPIRTQPPVKSTPPHQNTVPLPFQQQNISFPPLQHQQQVLPHHHHHQHHQHFEQHQWQPQPQHQFHNHSQQRQPHQHHMQQQPWSLLPDGGYAHTPQPPAHELNPFATPFQVDVPVMAAATPPPDSILTLPPPSRPQQLQQQQASSVLGGGGILGTAPHTPAHAGGGFHNRTSPGGGGVLGSGISPVLREPAGGAGQQLQQPQQQQSVKGVGFGGGRFSQRGAGGRRGGSGRGRGGRGGGGK